MKKRLSILAVLVMALSFLLLTQLKAQQDKVRPSLHASVTQRIGVDTDITIDYSRPGVKGRVIWGELVPYGMAEGNKYSKGKPYPWRAGANENTTIEFNKDITINGHPLTSGKYSIHMIPSKTDWTIIFNKKNDAWGSYAYDESLDALRITVKPVEAPHQEWLTFGFDELAGTSATAFMHWEKLRLPFKVAVAPVAK